MGKPSEHLFLELNLPDRVVDHLVSGLLKDVELYCLQNNLREHIEPLKVQMQEASYIYLRKINLSSNIY